MQFDRAIYALLAHLNLAEGLCVGLLCPATSYEIVKCQRTKEAMKGLDEVIDDMQVQLHALVAATEKVAENDGSRTAALARIEEMKTGKG